MSLTEPQVVMQRFVDEVINNRNLDAIEELVAEDFVEYLPMPGQTMGREGLKPALRAIFEAFPDVRWRIDEQVVQGEVVVSRFGWSGTHKGEYMGVAPTGRKVDVWGLAWDVVRDGKFVASRGIADSMGLLRQLGATRLPDAD